MKICVHWKPAKFGIYVVTNFTHFTFFQHLFYYFKYVYPYTCLYVYA